MMQVKQVPLPHVAAAEAMRNVGSAASGDVAEAGRRESTTTEAASASPRDEGLPKSPAADESRKLVGNKPVSRPSSSRTKPPGRGAQDDDAIQLRVNATIGIAPHLVTYSAIVPSGLRRGSYFLWTCNSEPISNGINGQKYLARPGKYELRVLMIAADSKEYEAKENNYSVGTGAQWSIKLRLILTMADAISRRVPCRLQCVGHAGRQYCSLGSTSHISEFALSDSVSLCQPAANMGLRR